MRVKGIKTRPKHGYVVYRRPLKVNRYSKFESVSMRFSENLLNFNQHITSLNFLSVAILTEIQ